jgi:hypothetical protein
MVQRLVWRAPRARSRILADRTQGLLKSCVAAPPTVCHAAFVVRVATLALRRSVSATADFVWCWSSLFSPVVPQRFGLYYTDAIRDFATEHHCDTRNLRCEPGISACTLSYHSSSSDSCMNTSPWYALVRPWRKMYDGSINRQGLPGASVTCSRAISCWSQSPRVGFATGHAAIRRSHQR